MRPSKSAPQLAPPWVAEPISEGLESYYKTWNLGKLHPKPQVLLPSAWTNSVVSVSTAIAQSRTSAQ